VRVSDFHFDLPEELIAQHPPAMRGASRMLVVDRSRDQRAENREQGGGAGLVDAMFRDLPEYLRAGDLLVLNDSRVLPARLFAVRAGLETQTGSPRPSGVVEVLLTEEVGTSLERDKVHPASVTPTHRDETAMNGAPANLWRALVRPAKKVRVGETLEFRGADGEVALAAEVVEAGEFGERTLRFAPVEDFYGVVGRIGHMPLPPYIRREQTREMDSDEDRERYQTVYAQAVGSAAAPTAGLHFTPEVLAALEARGVEIAYVTLHVGLGTFQPVRVAEVEDIRLHAERYTLPARTADALNRAVAEGRRVVAVGTTTTRTLEHIAGLAEKLVPGAKARIDFTPVMPGLKSRPISETNATISETNATISEVNPPVSETNAPGASEAPRTLEFEAHSGVTSIFIGPGYRFRVVGGLLTNFHLPESTLLMLVSAFAGERGRERVLAAYTHAVREGYRFYSYGDCMLLV
jgi:S-adenosylmethionine:tRNA ribosyltransferase-isomerase